MDRSAAFAERAVSCARGDLFILYTDGVLESASGTGEQFGQERLNALLSGSRESAPAGICQALVRGAEAFRGKNSAVDDVTVVAVKVTKGALPA